MCIPMEERNRLVAAHLWCIDSVLRQNSGLMQAAHLSREDVYQTLALRLIQAVERYRPGARSLKGYIFAQLNYELLNCKSAKRRYGLCAAPYDLRDAVISLEGLAEMRHDWESAVCAVIGRG